MSDIKKATSAPVVMFIIAILAFVDGINLLGFLPPETTLLRGVFATLAYPTYYFAAKNHLEIGDELFARTFLFFGLFFSLTGIIMLVQMFATMAGIPYDTKMMGVVWFVVVLYLLSVMPAFWYGDKVCLLFMITATLGFLIMSIVNFQFSFSFWPGFFVIAGISFSITGLTAAYFGMFLMLVPLGVVLPLGKPIFKKKETVSAGSVKIATSEEI